MATACWRMCSLCSVLRSTVFQARQRQNINVLRCTSAVYCSESSQSNGATVNTTVLERDPAPFFFNPEVQILLKKLTGFDMKTIFRTEPRPKFETPRYVFMTEEQLNKAIEDAKQRGEKRLQMPPVLKQREEIHEILSYDPELKGYDNVKYVFVDISPGISNRKRYIVSRDPDGTLRNASWDERDRMIKTFFPSPKQKYGIPKMFLDDHLMVVLDEGKYEFVLDRACWQFEPDDILFIKVCHLAYDHIDKHHKYDMLLSTRHYGPLVFYLAFYKTIDNLLLYLIQNDRLPEAADVLRVYHAVNVDSKSSKQTGEHNDIDLLKSYMTLDSHKRSSLEMALQTYEELQRQHHQYMQEVKEAHGHR